MILSLTAIDKEGEFRELSCWFDSLEFILDALSVIAYSGGQLLTAEVTENGSRTALPVEAFDGQLVSKPVKALEKQWQQVLSEPVNHQSVHNQWLLTVTRQRIQRQSDFINQLEGAIDVLEKQRQQVQNTVFQEPLRSRLINQVEKSVQCYQRHLATALNRQKTMSDRLVLSAR